MNLPDSVGKCSSVSTGKAADAPSKSRVRSATVCEIDSAERAKEIAVAADLTSLQRHTTPIAADLPPWNLK